MGYRIISYDLGVARTDKRIAISGKKITRLAFNGVDATIKLDSNVADAIDMLLVRDFTADKPFTHIYLTNTEQTGKTLILGFDNTYTLHKSGFVGVFRMMKLDADGTGNVFETDQDIDTTPTLKLDTSIEPEGLDQFVIKKITYYLNPTNAVTYQLFLLRGAAADNVTSYSKQIWASPVAQADGVLYHKNDIEIPVRLDNPDELFYMVDWSAACGDTTGFIVVEGEYYE